MGRGSVHKQAASCSLIALQNHVAMQAWIVVAQQHTVQMMLRSSWPRVVGLACVDRHSRVGSNSEVWTSSHSNDKCEVGLCRLSRADFNSGSYLPGASRIHDDTVVVMKGPNRRHSRPLCCNIFRTQLSEEADGPCNYVKWNVWKKGGDGQSLCCDDDLE